MRKIAIMLVLALITSCFTSLVACGPKDPENPGDNGGSTAIQETASVQASSMNKNLNAINSGNISESSTSYQLQVGGFILELGKTSGTLQIKNGSTNTVMYENSKPVQVNVRQGESLSSYVNTSYSVRYDSVVKKDYGYLATAMVSTANGGEYFVEDKYYVIDNAFAFDRTVSVESKGTNEYGFQTEVILYTAESNSAIGDYDYFVPGLLYKNREGIRYTNNMFYSDALAEEFVRETCTGMPLVMARNTTSGNVLSLQHLKPTVGAPYGGGNDGEVDSRFKYGSIGYYYTSKVALGYCFPSKVSNYQNVETNLYNPAIEGFSHAYTISLIPDNTSSYNDAMVNAYKRGYNNEAPSVVDMNVELIYDQNIEIFTSTYKEFGTGSVIAAGVPFAIYLPDGKDDQGYALAGGFVGQQVPIGYQLLQYGYDANDDETWLKGKTIMDFWTSDTIMGASKVPIVWWDASNTAAAGTKRNINNYLRYLTDIAEGMLDAYICAKSNGDTYTQWHDAVLQYADLFLELQMSDGSWYRCYKSDGTVCKNASGTTDVYGDEKNNSYMPVRFMGKMYELTGEAKYKDAALEAAEYCYNNLYLGDCKYRGGTADNANIIDKEAAVYAMYCFNTAYMLETDATMKANYYKAAEHAAVSAMSWTYVYDFAIPNSNDNAIDSVSNPFANGGTKGFSIIGTGVNAGDNYNNFIYYELYKMYLLRGCDEFYKSSALMLQNASKVSSDYDGRLGYCYRAMMPEATSMNNFKFASVGTWLPWSGIANIEPMMNMNKTFGTMDILKITASVESQLQQLSAYGIGGKII